jgi:hypothetical protein
MTWSGSWSRWRPAQPERRGSAIAAAIALTVRAHAIASMQPPKPKGDSRPQGMLGAEGVPRQGVSGMALSEVPIEPRKSAQRERQDETGGCAKIMTAAPNSPDLGCPQSPTSLLELGGKCRKAIGIRVSVVVGDVGEMQLARVFIRKHRELRRMGSFVVPRRRLLKGLASLAACAPAVVRASNIMRVSARFCACSHPAPPSAATRDALARLQHEMERRFAETLFGAEGLSAEAESVIPTCSPIATEAKITALWELRTSFGPRGSPPKALEDLPAEVRAGLASMFGSHAEGSSAARFSGFAAAKAVCTPFDNPSRSWNMTRVRSLDYARG